MREGGKQDEFFESINLDGTRHLLEACAAKAGRAVRLLQHDRDLRPPGARRSPRRRRRSRPGNIYERTKVSAEALVREFGAGRGLPSVILRPADVYGPRDQRLLKLFKGVSRGRFPLFGRGDGRRHMVYVDDVVSAFFKACERDEALGRGARSSPGHGPAPCAS